MNAASPEPLIGVTRTGTVPAIVRKSSELLKAMFNEQRCLFAYSTRMKDGKYVNDFSNPAVYRYTINSFAGIQQARSLEGIDWDIDKNIEKFVKLSWQRINNPADNGLLLYVLAVADHPDGHSQLKRVEGVVNDEKALVKLNLQEICWVLAGLTKYGELNGNPGSIVAAKKCWTILHRNYLNPHTFLPFYSLARCRRGLTSFGGIAYFLCGISEARTAIENSYRWLFGKNELHELMIHNSPFFVYRSIRRKTRLERATRYVRALACSALSVEAGTVSPTHLEINKECRSYHIGWLLFAWAGRKGFEEFSELQLLK